MSKTGNNSTSMTSNCSCAENRGEKKQRRETGDKHYHLLNIHHVLVSAKTLTMRTVCGASIVSCCEPPRKSVQHTKGTEHDFGITWR